MFCWYHHKHLIKDHLLQIKNGFDLYFKSYENIVLIGDFNAEILDSHYGLFLSLLSAIWNIISLIKEHLCYKNPDSPTCIEIVLTNSLR